MRQGQQLAVTVNDVIVSGGRGGGVFGSIISWYKCYWLLRTPPLLIVYYLAKYRPQFSHFPLNSTSMLWTLNSETNFLETNFLNKLILHSFEIIICTDIPYRVIAYQQKRNFPFFNRDCQYFCFTLCYGQYKKNQPTISCDTFFPVN